MALPKLKQPVHVIQRHKYGPVDPKTGEKTLLPTGCDVWPIYDDPTMTTAGTEPTLKYPKGREFKFWKSGHDLVKDGPVPDLWSQQLIEKALLAETAEAAELATIKAEVEPAKIDSLLAYAKANPKLCEEELEAISRKKLEVD